MASRRGGRVRLSWPAATRRRRRPGRRDGRVRAAGVDVVRRQPLRARRARRRSRRPRRLPGARSRPRRPTLGVALGEAGWDDDDYPHKLELVLAAPPAAVSFTFGLPGAECRCSALQAAGSLVLVTVTTPEEAAPALPRRARRALPAGLRGRRAPGQPGQRRPSRRRPTDPRAAGRRAAGRTLVPLVAAGGVGRPRRRAPTCWSGAPTLVQAGHRVPALPRERRPPRPEGCAWPILSFAATAVTRAFSGRRARALVNAMVRGHPDAPAAYPEINNATRPLRAAAARGRRSRAHEPLRRDRVPPGRGAGRRPRWSHTWRRGCAG